MRDFGMAVAPASASPTPACLAAARSRRTAMRGFPSTVARQFSFTTRAYTAVDDLSGEAIGLDDVDIRVRWLLDIIGAAETELLSRLWRPATFDVLAADRDRHGRKLPLQGHVAAARLGSEVPGPGVRPVAGNQGGDLSGGRRVTDSGVPGQRDHGALGPLRPRHRPHRRAHRRFGVRAGGVRPRRAAPARGPLPAHPRSAMGPAADHPRAGGAPQPWEGPARGRRSATRPDHRRRWRDGGDGETAHRPRPARSGAVAPRAT